MRVYVREDKPHFMQKAYSEAARSFAQCVCLCVRVETREKTSISHPRKTTTYILHVVPGIYHYAYARQTQVNWKEETKKRKEDKGKERKKKKAKAKKRKKKGKKRKDKKSKKRQEEEARKGKRKKMSY